MPTRNTDSFPRCSRLRQVRIYVLTEFFLKISNDNSMWCTASTLGVISAATAVCHDVWVGTEREPSKEVMQPRGASLWHPQELSIPVLPGDHISLGFRFRIFTTQRKIVFWYLNTRLPWWLKWQKQKTKNKQTKKKQKNVCLQGGRPIFKSWIRKVPCRRAWQHTPVFLPGESHEQRSMAGYGPWSCKESDTTERLSLSSTF